MSRVVSLPVYSLGVILYQLLTGFDISQPTFHFPPIASLAPDIPPALGALITQMMDFDGRNRPQSMEEVKLQLQDIMSKVSTPISLASARRPGGLMPSSPGRTHRRPTRGLIATILAIVIALALLLVYIVILDINAVHRSMQVASSNSNRSAATATATATVLNTDTPLGVVRIFCDAMNSSTPDFLTAYNQFSTGYRSKHTLVDFQKYFQGARHCVVASVPNASHQAALSLSMVCPHYGPPPGFGDRPPPPPPGSGPPPEDPQNKPANVTLISEGSHGWKIDSIYVVDYNCQPPPNQPPPR